METGGTEGTTQDVRPPIGTAADVAAMLTAYGIPTSEARVYRLTTEGVFPAIRIGRRIHYRLTEIEAWLANGGKGFVGGWRKHPKEAAEVTV